VSARVRLPIPIVVTGPAGSGKSKLTKAIVERSHCRSVNVGTLMEQELLRQEIHVNHRRDIGRLYLQQIGEKAYIDLVVESLRPGVVVDGVRLAAALNEARLRNKAFFHVARAERPGQSVAPSEPFAQDVRTMQTRANVVVQWTPTSADLGEEAARVLAVARLEGASARVLGRDSQRRGTLSSTRRASNSA
jgi:hypothetical protein